MTSMKKLTVLFLLFAFCKLSAQQYADPEYIKVTNERAAKIVDKLALGNKEKEAVVANVIAQQFRDLSKIQGERDAEIKKVKEDATLPKEKQNEKIDKLHADYLKKLGKHLNEAKITEVKDGMTYGVLPVTVTAYNDMIPTLTKEEKEYIYNTLVEAREHAMDGGSSDEKHAWFGKYKGRINNYLSKRGYDLTKEREGWNKRIAERKKAEATK